MLKGADIKDQLDRIPMPVRVSSVIILITIIVAAVARIVQDKKPTYSTDFIRSVKRLIAEAERNRNLATQDTSYITALMHINAALNYVHVLKRFMPESEIERVSETKFRQLACNIEEEHDKMLQNVETWYNQTLAAQRQEQDQIASQQAAPIQS